MDYIFEVVDKSGRKIHLAKERLSHIFEHKGMDKYIEEIKQTITKPITIISHEYGEIYDYYSYHKHIKSNLKYLKVVVKYLNNHGYIISAYFVPDITY